MATKTTLENLAADEYLMVACRGIGDGYGIVRSKDGQPIVVTPGPHDGFYRCDGEKTAYKMPRWEQHMLSSPYYQADDGVKLLTSQVQRIVGPLNCAEAQRVRLRRRCYCFCDQAFQRAAFAVADSGTDEEVAQALASLEAIREVVARRTGRPVDAGGGYWFADAE